MCNAVYMCDLLDHNAITNRKMTRYLANDSPTPLSANLSGKQNSNQKIAIFYLCNELLLSFELFNRSSIKRFWPLPWVSYDDVTSSDPGSQIVVFKGDECVDECGHPWPAWIRVLMGPEPEKEMSPMRNVIFSFQENVSAACPRNSV